MWESPDSFIAQTLLFGCTTFDTETNTFVLIATTDYILANERFEEPPFYKKKHTQSLYMKKCILA